MNATRHPPQRMHVNREQSKLLHILIKMHSALRKKKSLVERVYSLPILEAQEMFPDLAEQRAQTELNNIFEKAFVPVDWKKLRKAQEEPHQRQDDG